MPRKKTPAQLALMPQHKITQYNAYAKVQYSIGIQTNLEFQPLHEDTLKLNRAVQTDVKTVLSSVTVGTQSEIIGFIVPSCKWNEINAFVWNKPAKRKTHEENKDRDKKSKRCRPNSPVEEFKLGSPVLQTLNSQKDQVEKVLSETATANEITHQIDEPPAELSISLPTTHINTTSSALVALLSHIKYLNTDIFSIQHVTHHNGLLEQLEVSRKIGLIGISSYYDTPIRILFDSKGILTILTLFKPVEEFEYFDLGSKMLNVDIIMSKLELFSENRVFCSGLPKEECVGMENTKNLNVFFTPYERYQSKECLTWFVPPLNASKDKTKDKLYQCSKCRALNWYLTESKKKKAAVTPRTKLERQLVNSSCRIGFLTPKSRHNRISQIASKRKVLNYKIKQLKKKIQETNLQLSGDQDKKMTKVVAQVNKIRKN